MTKDEMVERLEEFLETNSFKMELFLKMDFTYCVAQVSAMNLLADIKGYKVQFCRKSARLNNTNSR